MYPGPPPIGRRRYLFARNPAHAGGPARRLTIEASRVHAHRRPADSCAASVPAFLANAVGCDHARSGPHPDEALELVVYLVSQSELQLKSWTPMRFGSGCQLLSPTRATRLALQPAVIGGVRFVNRLIRRADYLFNLDVRLVVGLHRLATMLRSTWGVAEIHHLGIGQGRGKSNDCHNTGRAMDLAGASGVYGGSPYSVDVLADWGRQPVTMPDGLECLSLAGGLPGHHLPAGRVNQHHRPRAVPGRVRVRGPGVRRHQPTAVRQRVPDGDRLVQPVHHPPRLPERGATWARPAHQNHMHFQIGPTGQEMSPP